MSATIGDGMTALALAGGIVGYLYMKHQSRQKRLELIHQERLLAMEKQIPLPEFPSEPGPRPPDPNVLIILGMVLSTLSVGAMIVLYIVVPAPAHALWISPLPIAFLGLGFIAFHLLQRESRR